MNRFYLFPVIVKVGSPDELSQADKDKRVAPAIEVMLLKSLIEADLVRHKRRALKREFYRRMAGIRRKTRALEALRDRVGAAAA